MKGKVVHPELWFWSEVVEDLLSLSGFEGDAGMGGLLMLLSDAAMNGDLCLRAEEASLRLAWDRFVRRHDTPPADIEEIIAVSRSLKRYAALVGTDVSLPVVLEHRGDVSLIFFQKYYRMRSVLETAFAEFGSEEARPLAQAREAFESAVHSAPVDLSADQRLAVALSLYSAFLIITGGPGTGKTTVIRAVLHALNRCGVRSDRIVLCAPTGRAARRIAESLGSNDEYTATTIHSLLAYDRSAQDFRFGPARRLPCEVLIVDEVSMVDVALMARLLSAVDPSQTRVILIGDRHQLPSVDAGAVLGDLVELLALDGTPSYSDAFTTWYKLMGGRVESSAAGQQWKDRMVELVSSHRSGSAIVRAARYVQDPAGNPPWEVRGLKEDPAEGVVHIPYVHGGENQLVSAWIDLCYGPQYIELLHRAATIDAEDADATVLIEQLSSITGGARILCALRHSEDGSAKVNQRFMKLFMQRARVIRFGDWFSGLPLMVTRNDHVRGLFNGETGLLLRFRSGFRWISARTSDIRSLPPEALPECEPAFATTIHKSQGSEYDRTLVWLPEDDHPLLSRQILYTAITRARRTAWIYGKDSVLRAAIERTQKRETGGLSPRK